MKAKIFQKLKQDYSHLGLGDNVLQAHAEALASMGLVTDENIDTVVLSQKTFLENLQKENDKRVTDATAKAKTSAKKEFEEELIKAEETKKKEAMEKAEKEKKEKDMPDWYKAEKASSEKMMQELLNSNKALTESFNALKNENDAYKAKEAELARKNLIISKAKELGIPQYRIDEGFMIAADADESAISDYLTVVSNNIKAQNLPSNRTVFPKADAKVDKAEADAIAKSLVG
jgi:hypothetical protein